MPFNRLVIGLLLVWSATAVAQLTPQGARVYGPSDRDTPTPVHLAKTATDGAALLEFINFVKFAGITSWNGAVGTGTITFGNSTDSYPATVSLLGSGSFRLDVKKSNGTESTILNGLTGLFISATGVRRSISSDIAIPGILGFTRLLSPLYPATTSIVSDQGLITIGGTSLHRITLDDPSPDGQGSPWKTVDLYFSPKTGQLVQSTGFVHLSSSDAALYMLQTNYSNYRTVAGSTLPYTYTQTLNGQPQWTLTLSSIDLSNVPDSSLFTF